MEFKWDPGKAASNELKHGVPFDYAAAVFLDGEMETFDVSRAGDQERRAKAVGLIEGRLFTVVYTRRGQIIRIISARRSNIQEARRYGHG